MKFVSEVAELIGGTPLVEIRSLGKGLPAKIVLKLEYSNPGHSIKDRVAAYMIRDAENKGERRPRTRQPGLAPRLLGHAFPSRDAAMAAGSRFSKIPYVLIRVWSERRSRGLADRFAVFPGE